MKIQLGSILTKPTWNHSAVTLRGNPMYVGRSYDDILDGCNSGYSTVQQDQARRNRWLDFDRDCFK